MENLLIKGNSKVPKRRKRTSKGKMERSLNPLKQSLVSNAMDMVTSRRNVLII